MTVSASVTKLSNLTSSFEKMKIGIDLENAAFAGNSVIHLGLQQAFLNKHNINDVIEWVRSQALDNVDLMAEIIGDTLTSRILKLKP